MIRDQLAGVEVLNTGRVINAVRPDILCLVEVEDRLSVARSNEQVLQHEFQYPFLQHLLVDGNDDRGTDISLLSQRPILGVRSYTDVPRPGKTEPVFSRDCPEFTVELAGGQLLIVLAWPLVAALCRTGFRYPAREVAYIRVGGAGAPGADRISHVVFFIVVANALVPGGRRWRG